MTPARHTLTSISSTEYRQTAVTVTTSQRTESVLLRSWHAEDAQRGMLDGEFYFFSDR